MNNETAIVYLRNTLEYNDLEYGSVRQLNEVIQYLREEDSLVKKLYAKIDELQASVKQVRKNVSNF